MVSIARKNLLEDIPRFLVAQAGIMFAVSLVTIQTGIFQGVIRSTVSLIADSQADIWIASRRMVHLELTEPILFDSKVKADEVKGVEKTDALIIGSARWFISANELSVVKVFGFNPNKGLLVPGKVIQGSVSDLEKPYTLIVDKSKLRSLKVNKIGDRAKLGSLSAEIAGITQDSQSAVSGSFVFSSLETANAYVNSRITSSVNCKWEVGEFKCVNIYEKVDPAVTTNQPNQSATDGPQPIALNTPISFVLVKAKPGEDLKQLQQRLQKALPQTNVYIKDEMIKKIGNFWERRTGIGFILGLGAVVGVIVGIVIVGQILYSSVSDHIKEFGTLKAMGASNKVIYGIILEQALWMAVIGYIPGILLCWGLGMWTSATQGIVILITPTTAVGVFGITLFMCVSSAIFAIQKVNHVDPAIVFKA
ncbi:ABC transporter, permease protein, putative [Richelia intracellularis]|nr:ABC transporter, permease protein, putative [Richelia intracellularis]